MSDTAPMPPLEPWILAWACRQVRGHLATPENMTPVDLTHAVGLAENLSAAYRRHCPVPAISIDTPGDAVLFHLQIADGTTKPVTACTVRDWFITMACNQLRAAPTPVSPAQPVLALAQGGKYPASMRSLDVVLAEVVAWGRETFPASSDGGRTKHLLKEARELDAHPASESEMADVLMILAHHAAAHGVDLADACRAKLAVCRTRKWGKPDADGVVEHIRPSTPEARP